MLYQSLVGLYAGSATFSNHSTDSDGNDNEGLKINFAFFVRTVFFEKGKNFKFLKIQEIHSFFL